MHDTWFDKNPHQISHLTMNGYQADMATTAIYTHRVIYPTLGLVNEAGEVAGKIKKLMRDEGVSFLPGTELSAEKKAALAAELGDVLWYIAALARDLNLSLNEVAHMNLEKLRSRKERGTLGGSGDNR